MLINICTFTQTSLDDMCMSVGLALLVYGAAESFSCQFLEMFLSLGTAAVLEARQHAAKCRRLF